MPKFEFPISGHIIVESDDILTAEKRLSLWIFETLRNNSEANFDLPDVFGTPNRPSDIIIEIDHNHVVYLLNDFSARMIKNSANYQHKKLSVFLPKQKRDAVRKALEKFL